jgi:hypothetical protein
MTPLRDEMIESMRQRGFSVRTQQSYTSSVAALARYHGCSPERLESWTRPPSRSSTR